MKLFYKKLQMKKLLKKQTWIEQLKIAFTMHKDNFNNNKYFTLTTNTNVQSWKYNSGYYHTRTYTHTDTHGHIYQSDIQFARKAAQQMAICWQQQKTG